MPRSLGVEITIGAVLASALWFMTPCLAGKNCQNAACSSAAPLIGRTCFHVPVPCSASQRSTFRCIFNQTSGVLEKARDNRNAISNDIGARPLTIADTVFLETPSRSASAVTVRFNGSIYNSFKMSPGMDGRLVLISSI